MKSVNLRHQIPSEIFDYQTLMCALSQYASPRDKITNLLRHGTIVRIRKGLYVFGRDERKSPLSRELLANLMYGPSYISLEYGLQHYGLIPERVEILTSVTPGRSRKFSTPVGVFSFRQIPMRAFAVGMDLIATNAGNFCFIALPEKVLVDKLHSAHGVSIKSLKDMQLYLEEDLRIEISELRQMQPQRIAEYADLYRSRKALFLRDLIHQLRQNSRRVNSA